MGTDNIPSEATPEQDEPASAQPNEGSSEANSGIIKMLEELTKRVETGEKKIENNNKKVETYNSRVGQIPGDPPVLKGLDAKTFMRIALTNLRAIDDINEAKAE